MTATVSELTRRNIEQVARVEKASDQQRTLGERLADRFAKAVGSWTFIITQSVILAIWVMLNLIAWSERWDPYPFILLNLALSFQAAFASPIIMMSQNRQAKVADKRNQLDLQINLLSEQENTEMLRLLRLLCEKNGIDVVSNSSCQMFEQETSTEDLLAQIENVNVPAGGK